MLLIKVLLIASVTIPQKVWLYASGSGSFPLSHAMPSPCPLMANPPPNQFITYIQYVQQSPIHIKWSLKAHNPTVVNSGFDHLQTTNLNGCGLVRIEMNVTVIGTVRNCWRKARTHVYLNKDHHMDLNFSEIRFMRNRRSKQRKLFFHFKRFFPAGFIEVKWRKEQTCQCSN